LLRFLFNGENVAAFIDDFPVAPTVVGEVSLSPLLVEEGMKKESLASSRLGVAHFCKFYSLQSKFPVFL